MQKNLMPNLDGADLPSLLEKIYGKYAMTDSAPMPDSCIVRHAAESDLPQMMAMYENSRNIMRANGNDSQWTDGYPDERLILNDIHNKTSYVIEGTGPNDAPFTLVGCFTFLTEPEPTYKHIEGDGWQEDDVPYGTIHRLASAPKESGISAICINYCDEQAPSLRIDTHADNVIMRNIAEREGFSYRGIIHLADGSPRMAYQRLLPHQLLEALYQYVQQSIMPRYRKFDTAHQTNHISSVINRSLAMAAHYDVNINMVFAAAAFHDLGLSKGREIHHLVSANIIRNDVRLEKWFSRSQIETMAQAAEDHRASSRDKPRSIYGLILAEADRDLDCRLVVKRTIQYSFSHHPAYTQEQHWQRVLQHLKEKYGTGGYLQLYLPDSPNIQPLATLRALIADEPKLRTLFDELYPLGGY